MNKLAGQFGSMIIFMMSCTTDCCLDILGLVQLSRTTTSRGTKSWRYPDSPPAESSVLSLHRSCSCFGFHVAWCLHVLHAEQKAWNEPVALERHGSLSTYLMKTNELLDLSLLNTVYKYLLYTKYTKYKKYKYIRIYEKIQNLQNSLNMNYGTYT